MATVFCEAGMQIKERKASWHESFKDSQKREDDVVQNTAELLPATRMDKGRMAEPQHCFDSWARSCDEAKVVLEQQKSRAVEDLKQWL